MTVLFLPNAGPGVGGGHVLRCLSLARALRVRGLRCAFATPSAGVSLVERFGEGLFDAISAETTEDAAEACRPAEICAVVVDHYGRGAREEKAFAGRQRAVMVLDDLADRRHVCDVLLDPGYGRVHADYAGKVSRGARLLLGPDYALLRPEFDTRRAVAFTPVRDEVGRVFVSFGLSDVEGVTARAVSTVRQTLPDVRIDVALASDARSLPELRARAAHDPLLTLHVDVLDVASLLEGADIAVGAGGSATWERACVGIPTLAVVVADNQRSLIGNLDDAGVVLGCDVVRPSFEAQFPAALARLRSPALRQTLRERSRVLCDGKGAERAADALLSVLEQKR